MAVIAARYAKALECCVVRNGSVLGVGVNSTQQPASSNKGMGITVPNLAGQHKTSLGNHSHALCVARTFTGHNGKSAKVGLSFALSHAKLMQREGWPQKTGGMYSLRGCGSIGSVISAKTAEQPKGLSSTISFPGLLAAGQSKRTRRRFASHATGKNTGTRICRTTHFCETVRQDVDKSPLIDLEAQKWATGRKQAKAVQRERLSEGTRATVMRQSEPRYNFHRSWGERSEAVAPPAILQVIKVTDCMYYSGGEVLDIAASDVLSAAEFDWKQAACAVTATGLEIDVQNVGKEAIIDLLEARIKNAQRTMKNNITNGLYSDGAGTGGKQIGGLQLLVADTPTSGTVGGINRANFSFWQNKSFDCTTDGGAATTAANIQQYMNTLYLECVRGADKPDLILADSTKYALFWASLQAIQRVNDSKMAEAGFQAVKFAGADVVYEDATGIPAGNMYFLNTDYIMLRYAPRRLFKPLERVQSINQDAIAQLILFAGNMTVSNCSLQGVMKE